MAQVDGKVQVDWMHYFASPKFYKMVQVDRMVQVDKMGHFTVHRLTMQEASDSGLEAKLV